MNDLEERLARVLVTQFEVDADKITPAARFLEDLEADSLEVVELIMTIEETFNVTIPDDRAERLRTVDNVINFLKSKQSA